MGVGRWGGGGGGWRRWVVVVVCGGGVCGGGGGGSLGRVSVASWIRLGMATCGHLADT